MTLTPPNINWFCVRTRAGYELHAMLAFSYVSSETQDAIGKVEVYFPRIRKSILIGGQKRTVLTPLFPGYFFARFDFARAGRFIATRPGVIDILRFGSHPAEVPGQVIEDLKSADLENSTEVAKPFHFVSGQRLLINEGPFAGMEAEYVASLNGGQRALLLVEYLKQCVTLVAPQTVLRLAS